jgi:hypothetical protein
VDPESSPGHKERPQRQSPTPVAVRSARSWGGGRQNLGPNLRSTCSRGSTPGLCPPVDQIRGLCKALKLRGIKQTRNSRPVFTDPSLLLSKFLKTDPSFGKLEATEIWLPEGKGLASSALSETRLKAGGRRPAYLRSEPGFSLLRPLQVRWDRGHWVDGAVVGTTAGSQREDSALTNCHPYLFSMRI